MSQSSDPVSKSTTRTIRVLHIAIALLSLCGLADALYLTVQHITGQSVRCTLVSGCSEVLSSSYAVVAGYPLAAVGAFAYFSVFSLAVLALFDYPIVGRLLLPLVLAMCVVSLWLIYLQAFVIHAFCQFCLLSAAITFVLTGLSLALWWIRRKAPVE